MRLGELGDVIPVAKAGVDLGVVDRVEACVRAIERGEERQNVHALVYAVESRAQNVGHRSKIAVTQAIRIGDQLNFVLHGSSLDSSITSSGYLRGDASA